MLLRYKPLRKGDPSHFTHQSSSLLEVLVAQGYNNCHQHNTSVYLTQLLVVELGGEKKRKCVWFHCNILIFLRPMEV